MYDPVGVHPEEGGVLRKTISTATCEGHGWRRTRIEHTSPGLAGTSSGEKAYAMPTMSRLDDQRSFYGPSERERRDRFHRVALSELWRHHRPCHCAPSGNDRSFEIEAALVGSPSHAFRFVKQQKACPSHRWMIVHCYLQQRVRNG
jgi:hypothetical protein